jgi:hypothetical protein
MTKHVELSVRNKHFYKNTRIPTTCSFCDESQVLVKREMQTERGQYYRMKKH